MYNYEWTTKRHKLYGRNPIPEPGAASLSTMAVVSPERDNSFSRVFTRGRERIADKESQTMQSSAE